MKWLPLPKIAHGIAVYPFSPTSLQSSLEQNDSSGNSRPLTAYSAIQSPLLSPQLDSASMQTPATPTSMLTTDHASHNPADYACLIELEVGDELFILEQYGDWYRGYVFSSLEEGKRPNTAPVGCFPKTHVQIKDYLDVDATENERLYEERIASHHTDTFDAPWITTPGFASLSRSLSESHISLQASKLHYILPPSPHELPKSRPTSHSDMPFGPHDVPETETGRHALAPSLLLARFDQSTITGSSEPLVDEIAACVSEWNCLLYKYLEQRRYSMFNTVRHHINYLLQSRRQLLDQALSKEELSRLRRDIINRMILLNIAQDCDMIIRHPERGYILDANNVSLPSLLRMHWNYALCERISLTDTAVNTGRPITTIMSAGSAHDTPTSQTTPNSVDVMQPASTSPSPPMAKFYHLFFELKACVAHICQPGEFTELSFSLYNNIEHSFITEQFVVVLTINGMPKDMLQIGQLHTLFTDLAAHDVTEHLYLVCRIVRLGSIKNADKDKEHFVSLGGHASMFFGGGESRMKSYFDPLYHKRQPNQLHPSQSMLSLSGSSQYRRPFGCAVLHVGALLATTELSPTSALVSPSDAMTAGNAGQLQMTPAEHDIPIYTATSESSFATLHQDIINNNTKEFSKSARAENLCVYLRLFYGQFDSVQKTHASLLQNVPRTLRLGFPDAVFPDTQRDELYITLNSGDFTQFPRTRNIQVNICIRDNYTGDVVENAISAGSGSPCMSSWDSMIFYHDQHPKWEETFKVEMPDQRQWHRSHLFLTVIHRSSHGSSSSHHGGQTPSSGQASSGNDRIVAVGFLPLFLPPLHSYFVVDGTHTLRLFKYDSQFVHPRAYLDSLPWCLRSSAPFNMQNQEYALRQQQNNGTAPTLHKSHSSYSIMTQSSSHTSDHGSSKCDSSKLVQVRDTVTVKTFLCSTHYTQNETLVKLNNWRTVLEATSEDGGCDQLVSILTKFPFVGEMEAVKFLNDIFDALLDILIYEYRDKDKQQQIRDEALGTIVWVLGIVQDRRFSNFRPVLDVYLEQKFSVVDNPHQDKKAYKGGKVSEAMLTAMIRLCTDPSNPKKGKRLRSSMKTWKYLFRIIVRSRLSQRSAEDEGERALRDIMFKDELRQLLDLINQMVLPDQPSVMIGTQTLALQNFASILGELRHTFSSKELMDIIVSFMDSCAHLTGKLVGYRLGAILAIVKGSIFNDQACRVGLAKSVFRWIRVWLNSYLAVAKGVIFSRLADSEHPDNQQTRLTRVQWLENLRLSLTIVSGVLDSVRRQSGLVSSGMSSSSISSPSLSLSTHSRPVSIVTTNGDEELTEESVTEIMTITETALHIVPQLLNAYKDLQRLTTQAIHATAMVADQTVSMAGLAPATKSGSRHSLSLMRDRSNSTHLKQSSPLASSDEGGSGFTVLQALTTSPAIPFPSTYPLQPTPLKNNPAIAATGHLAAMVTTGLMDITVVILELFYLTPQHQWVNYLYSIYKHEGVTAVATLLRKVSHVCMGILFGDSMEKSQSATFKDNGNGIDASKQLPSHWLNLSAIAHHIILTHVLAPVVSVFELMDLPVQSADQDLDPVGQEQHRVVQDLWRVFFVSLLRVISSPRLEIESFLPQTQRALWKLTGNMKGAVGAKALLSLWRLTKPRHGPQSTTENDKRPTDKDEEDGFMSAPESPSANRSSMDMEDTDLVAAKAMLHAFNEEHKSKAMAATRTMRPPEISSVQLDLIPVILGPLCAVSLTLHDTMRLSAVSVMADIMMIELQQCGDLSRVQNILITAIDVLVMSDNKGDDTIRTKLMTALTRTLETRLREQGMDLLVPVAKKTVNLVDEFFSLLLQIRSLPQESGEFIDDRTSATLQLMQFIQLMERQDIYIKYVHQLVTMHANNNNEIEAALTLQFHADLLSWGPYEELEAIPDMDLPNQSAFARKELLYWKMIELLEKASAWELCIKLCKELAHQYEHTTYEYGKLSKVLQKQAEFVEDIMTKERYFAEYFCVAFYGRGFPTSVRNKQFIYRGQEWEKIASFTERIQSQYPNAQLVSAKLATGSFPSEEQLQEFANELEGQYLCITAVVPENEQGTNPFLENALVPENVKKYYMSNKVDRFSYSRPFDKTKTNGTSDNANKPETDFLNLWTKKTTLVCENKFPTASRRSTVVSVENIEISPIENAVLAIQKKNQELSELNRKYAVHSIQSRRPSAPVNISPFSMALNGAVDAPVNGGVSLYRKAFLTDAYWEKNPEMRPWVRQLKMAILDQVDILEKCLETHRKLVSADMRPFHQNLVDFFKKNFHSEIERLQRHRESRRSTGSDTTGDAISERPTLSRHSSFGTPSAVLPLSPSLPMSPVFSSRRPSTDPRPPNTEPPATPPKRAETLSRSIKMSLRKKKRNPQP